MNLSFRDTLSHLAAASMTIRTFSGLLGLRTGWCGRSHCFGLGADASSGVIPDVSFLSVDSSHFSVRMQLSGNFTSPSLHNIPTSYLSHTCFTVLSKVSRALLSSRERGVTSSYFVPKDSVRHQSSTCLLNDSSPFRTWCTCIACRRSGFTIDLTEPARVQPKAVRIATGCPGRPFRTSCCHIASHTFAPSKIVTSCGGRFNCGIVQASSTVI